MYCLLIASLELQSIESSACQTKAPAKYNQQTRVLALSESIQVGMSFFLLKVRVQRDFLVSSKILSMASPVFTKLFSPNFSEGMQMEFSSCPILSLHEDDMAAMRTITRILHYQEPTPASPITAETFATLAYHCNKYDCTRAIWPWTFKWFNDFQSITTAEEYGYLLLAAHFFRSVEQFHRISARVQVQLSPAFS